MDAFTDNRQAALARPDAGAADRRLQHLIEGYQKFVGHDLPNQLVSIQAYALMLNDPGLPPSPEEARLLLTRLAVLSRRIAHQAHRLDEVGRLLREPPWGPPVSLAEAAHEAIAAVRTAWPGADEDRPAPDFDAITFHVGETLPAVPLARRLLHQVLVELLRNAAAALVPGRGGRVEVAGSWGPTGGTLGVSDTGPGLPPQRAAQLADPAVAAGLGLLLVRQAAALWRGRLLVAASEGRGTTVTVTVAPATEGDGE